MNMNSNFLPLLLTAVLVTASATAVEIEKLEASIETLQGYEYDKTGGVDLGWVESQVAMASVDDSVRDRAEAKLIESLAAAKTNDARQFLCRQLRTIGTAKCVPQLASLLDDAEISHMACYALGRIEAPEAGEALRKALAATSGRVKAGIVNTLVQIVYQPAAADIMKLVSAPDKNVALAAVRATGCFGTRADVETLLKMRDSVSEGVRVEVDAALLECAARLAANGDSEFAVRIYERYLRGKYPEHLRTAGLRGLALADETKALSILVEAIKGDDPAIRGNAVAMMALIEGGKTTEALMKLCGVAAPDAQELIVRSLAARGDTAAAPAAISLLASEHEAVRVAAIEALGEIGTREAIPILAKVAASGTPGEKRYARFSLAGMRGEEIDKAFIHHINAGDPQSRLEIIRAVGQRLDHKPFTVLCQVATSDLESSLRREAIMSMGRIGTPADLPALVRLAIAPKDASDRGTIKRAILIVFSKMDSRDSQADAVLAALQGAPDQARPTLLNLLATPATDRAFGAVSSAVASANSEVRDAAIQALCRWPGPAPVELLYKIASTSGNESHRSLALNGYIQLAPLTPDPTSCYVKALKLAKSDDEKRRVLGGLQHAGTRKALEIAESYLNHPTLKADAYQAAVKVLGVYCWQDRSGARAALDKIVTDAPDDGIRDQARNVIRKMDEYKSVITAWKGTPMFMIPGVADGARVFETVFEPEKNFGSEATIWRIILPEFEGGGKIDLEKTYGAVDCCCAYLRTTVHSPIDQEARLNWQADDAIKGWLNGEPTNAGTIRLKKGANLFIVKVGDHGGGWSFKCEILKPDDSPLDGLRYEL
jgi:HEAT repeat protein